MITLYELHWSHDCEKVRLALNFMGLPWRAVAIDGFRKTELLAHPRARHLPVRTVPAIHDASTDRFVMDSTPILRFLSEQHRDAPALFPGDAAQRAAIDARLLEFDTQLGLLARRLGYTQLILEAPSLLPELFLGQRAGGFFLRPVIRPIAAWFIALLLITRLELQRSEELGLYEALEAYLLKLAAELEGRPFVVGERVSAADLALAAQLRPLCIVPFFAEHPRLQDLFARPREILGRWAGEGDAAYQRAVAAARLRRPPRRRRLRAIEATMPFAPRDGLAANDQRPAWRLGLLAAPWHLLRGLRRNKRRQRHADAAAR